MRSAWTIAVGTIERADAVDSVTASTQAIAMARTPRGSSLASAGHVVFARRRRFGVQTEAPGTCGTDELAVRGVERLQPAERRDRDGLAARRDHGALGVRH